MDQTGKAYSLEPTHRPQCPDCRRGVGLSDYPVVVTGLVDAHPSEPDGLDYRQCASCRRFVRCEIVDRRQTPRSTPNIQASPSLRSAA